jgi:GNAT superfamily N-acetyltransferase
MARECTGGPGGGEAARIVNAMPAPVVFRPFEEGDLDAVHDSNGRAFADLDRRSGGDYPAPPQSREAALLRLRHLLETDPGGAWVAERDGEIAGCAMAIVREGVWGLSLLFADPGIQSAGVGRELLARAFAYGDGARGHVILSSPDARAMRAYARLGLALHPCVSAYGAPQDVTMPPDVREGGLGDLPLTETVDRAVRGAAHGRDIVAMLEAGSTLLVLPERGYAVVKDGMVRLAAAFDEEAASTVLRAALARSAAGERSFVEWLTAAQQWAIAVCVEARLELRSNAGAVFLGGDVGPFRPYLPNGAYL